MPRIQLNLPQDKAPGVFADFVRAWHTRDAFVLDFSSYTDPPVRDEVAEDIVQQSAVVSRVRIPPAQVFELMKALEQQLSAWESENNPQGSGRPAK
ncbi:MAG: DUF3467 domain-containing protein [Propionibacteriaceae bacterium]|jgi:hypothetical protein|nr:DUF3467 domain-containing protein [Propionibacteriaceae bacterium]